METFRVRARGLGVIAWLVAAMLSTGCDREETPQALLAAGKADAAKRDHSAAVIRYKTALQKDPQSSETRFLLGVSLLAIGDGEGAIVALNQALEQKYSRDLVMPELARALVLTGAHKKLVLEFSNIELTDPAANAGMKTSIATAWIELGDLAKGRAALDAALRLKPDHVPARLLKARLLSTGGDSKAGLALVEEIIAADPASAEAWHLKGQISSLIGKDPNLGDSSYRKALEIKADFAPAHLSLIATRLVAGEFDAARALLEKMRGALPKSPYTLLAEAQVAFAAKDYNRARENGQRLLRLFPNHTGVLHLVGAIEEKLGSLLAAERYLVKALNFNPTLNEVRKTLAQVYIRLGQPGRTLSILKPLLEQGVADAAAHALAGDAQQRLGDVAAAERHYRSAMAIDPSDSRVSTAIATTQFARGESEVAFARLEQLSRSSKDTYADSALVSARLKRREFDAALEALQSMARKDPSSASVREWRGRILVDRREFVGARSAFEEALKIDPRLFSATAGLAMIDMLEKKPEQAQKRFEETLKADPRNHLASMALAELLLKSAKPFESVKEVLVQAINNSPGEAAPRLQLIQHLLKRRQYKEAVLLAQEAAAALPGDAHVLDALGRAQSQAGDVEQAIGTFRSLAGANPDSPVAYTRLADLYRVTGNRSAEEASLRKALEVDPSLAAAQDALVELMLRDKRLGPALELARGIQRSEPLSPVGYLVEAKIHLRNKAPDEALAAYRKGLAVPGVSGELGRLYYIALLNAGRAAEADQFAAGWIQKHPDDVAFDYQMAVTAITRGNLDQAETRLQRVVAQRPTHPLALNNLAWTLAYRNKPGGVAFARRAVELYPDRPTLLDTLAMALAAEGQVAQALSTQQRAVDMEPENQGLRLNLAKIALKAGDKNLARKELESLKSVGPTLPYFKEVNELLAKI